VRVDANQRRHGFTTGLTKTTKSTKLKSIFVFFVFLVDSVREAVSPCR
jgi:hypothetical protein